MHVDIQPFAEYAVAPYVGAWIETERVRERDSDSEVAPYVGAWIETLKYLGYSLIVSRVAPYVGAWIETERDSERFQRFRSHPTWVRGLKRLCVFYSMERGYVAPYVGAWIETKHILSL